MKRTATIVLGLGLLAAACGKAPEQPENAADGPPAKVNQPEKAPERQVRADEPSAMPADFHGRWGIVPADCEPGRADAKGLLVINGEGLRYYESTGKVSRVEERRANHFVANFAMMGEGMEWDRRIGFDLSHAGQTLVATQSGGEVPYEPITYRRCP